MPRRRRQLSPTGVYHWINRGVNQKRIFHKKEDYSAFFKLLKDHKEELNILIFHYCLMTNHIHMLLQAQNLEDLAKFSYYIQRRYAYYYCKTHGWKGQVFQRMYRSLPVAKDTYLLECGRYIERNPLRAGMVQNVAEYVYSSFSFYANGSKNDLLTPSPAYLGLSNDVKERQKLYQKYVLENRIYEELVDKALLTG